MKLKYVALVLAVFSHVGVFASSFFYCVTTNNNGYHFDPDTKINYSVVSQPLAVGQKINLGEHYAEYTVNAQDIAGGKFSSTFGFLTPKAYFVFPRSHKERADYQQLVSDLKEQCKTLLKATGLADHVFKEIRVSESSLSGTALIIPGHPAVFLDIPAKPGEQNIHRIADR